MAALTGRRVVVTRAAEQADELADLLRAHGAVPVVVPLIHIAAEPAEMAALAAADPTSFEWLVVTSPNAAEAYVSAHPGHGAAGPANAPSQVAAVGAATAAVLTAAGVPVALLPAQQRASGLLAQFPSAHGSGRVLLVQAAAAAPTMAVGLGALGWQVTTIQPYRSVPARPT